MARRLPTLLTAPDPPWVALRVVPGDGADDPATGLPPGFVVRRVDGRRCRTKTALLAELARALAFPSHFGRNWDALEDCLGDLGWLPATGYVLVVARADQLLRGRPADYRTLVAILGAVGARWAAPEAGPAARPAMPFHTLLEVPAGRVRTRREWGAVRLDG